MRPKSKTNNVYMAVLTKPNTLRFPIIFKRSLKITNTPCENSSSESKGEKEIPRRTDVLVW